MKVETGMVLLLCSSALACIRKNPPPQPPAPVKPYQVALIGGSLKSSDNPEAISTFSIYDGKKGTLEKQEFELEEARLLASAGYGGKSTIVSGGITAAGGTAVASSEKLIDGAFQTVAAPLHENLAAQSAVMIGDTFYTCGGVDKDISTSHNKCYAYTESTDSWTELEKPMLTAVHMAPAVTDDKESIYILGGLTDGSASAALQKYNTAAAEWTSLADVPAGLRPGLNGQGAVYLAESQQILYCGIVKVGLNKKNTIRCAKYNVAENTWSGVEGALPSEHDVTDSMQMIKCGGEVLIFNNYDTDEENNLVKAVLKYNTASNRIEPVDTTISTDDAVIYQSLVCYEPKENKPDDSE
jgi:N-acetylneuraminic acid mutarotase